MSEVQSVSVYYHKLWTLLNERGITQKSISQDTGISASTFAKMRNGEYVALDILDRIRMVLDCDYGDIITAVPENSGLSVDWRNDNIADKANAIYRQALLRQMSVESLSTAQVAERTTLALNTVKGFLKGKNLSSNSLTKLMRLGMDFNEQVNMLILQYKIHSVTYCKKPVGRSKRCMGLRSEYRPETNDYAYYCLYGFPVEYDEESELITQENCPHPKNTREMGEAIEKYGSHLRNQPITIPAKNEEADTALVAQIREVITQEK